jgi:hypothetical protein
MCDVANGFAVSGEGDPYRIVANPIPKDEVKRNKMQLECASV